MATEHHDDDLAPETTTGFKVGEQKTIDEYHKLGKLLHDFDTNQMPTLGPSGHQ